MPTVELGKALYFPYIELGNRVQWLKTAALYHDRIFRIVPGGYHTYDPDDVKKLIETGFIDKRSPKQAAQALAAEFYVFASDNLVDAEKRTRLATALHASDLWGQIHIDKIDPALANALAQDALLRETDGDWYEVEPVTALLYMTFLAKKLARGLPLISDDAASQQLAYGTCSAGSQDDSTAGDIGYRIASTAIRTWVPVDLANVPMSAIISIRREHEEERVAFYTAVGALGKDLSKVVDENDLRDAIAQRQVTIGRSLDALRVRLESQRIAVRSGLMGVSVPAIAKAVGVTAPIMLAGLGVISAGCLVWKHLRDVKSTRLESSWSYLLTLTDELDDFDVNRHFTRLGIDGDHLPAPPEPSKVARFKRFWRQIGRKGI